MQLIKIMHKKISNNSTFPPLNYSRSYFTQWLLKDIATTEEDGEGEGEKDCNNHPLPPPHPHHNNYNKEDNPQNSSLSLHNLHRSHIHHHHHRYNNNNSSSSSSSSGGGGGGTNKKRNNMELIQLLAINALEFTAPVYSFLNKEKPFNNLNSTTTTKLPPPAALTEESSTSVTTNKTTTIEVEAASSQKNTTTTATLLPSSTSSSCSDKILNKKSSTELNKELKLDREFIQLSGHPGSFAPAGPNSIWKKMPNDSCNEASVYERLRDSDPPDCMLSLIPSYISRTEWNGSTFIELEDLVTRFDVNNLNIMDMKLGIRTFLESEVTNSKPRSDLYEKMYKLDKSSLTSEEVELKSVTKLRYMQFREEMSSTKSLGFRIEGVKLSNYYYSQNCNELINGINLQRVKDEHKISQILKSFCGEFFNKILIDLRNNLENSQFFTTHEIIGSSLLLIHDHSKCGAWIIDFAKTFELDKITTHRLKWEMGNREDGVLIGIDNIIRLITT